MTLTFERELNGGAALYTSIGAHRQPPAPGMPDAGARSSAAENIKVNEYNTLGGSARYCQ
ncbi:MAG: hypothetical protein ACHQIL_05810 [Steroidobacterales bacterium]